METSGPLAGLRGVLPLASAIIEPHAPPKPAPPSPYKETAHIFESILAAPAIAPTVPAAKPKRRVWTMRPLIYVLMVLAVLIPFFVPDIANSSVPHLWHTGGRFLRYDSSLAAEFDCRVVVRLRSGQRRRNGFAGERARAPSDDQARQDCGDQHAGPTGAQIAQRVLDNAARASGNYTYGTNYLNLGYVPGQEAGLAQLATAGFAPTTQRLSQEIKRSTNIPTFVNIQNWRNVALLIELAGSAEPLQKWMEQVQPRAGVKIAAGVSAAVEPRARTYRNAKQLVAIRERT